MSAALPASACPRPAPPPSAQPACTGAGVERAWTLKRNCSLYPAQFLGVVGSLLGVSGLVALCGLAAGLPLISAFCLVEMAVIVYAALDFARHARDGEKVTLLADGRLVLEIQDGLRTTRHEFNRHWLRIVRQDEPRDSLWLCYGKLRLRLARHVPPKRRARFECEIRRALRARPGAFPGPSAS